jgi:hypothetical protein
LSVIAKAVLAAFAVPAIAAGTGAAPHSTAAAKPTAEFSFTHNRVKQKTRAQFTYATAHLPQGSSVYLQWQVGTAHVWQNVLRLKHASGTDSTPRVGMGKWKYRIRVVRDRSTVVSSRSRTLYAYGTVSYARLCDVWTGGCTPFDVQIGETDFTAVYGVNLDYYPDFSTVLQYHATSCRSVDMQYATQNSGEEEYIQLVQSKGPAQSGQGPGNQVNTFKASMDGGPFILEAADDTGDWLYLNGSANCYTNNGKP